MHELAITDSILSIATKHAIAAEATAVSDIHILVGRLSSIIDDSVQFYWGIIAKDTICEKAILHFIRIPAELECLECGTKFLIEAELIPCLRCGSNRVKILSGNEFRVESIEITK